MSATYSIAAEVAWVDAAAGGRTEHTVWIARLDTGRLFALESSGWLVWSLLADGVDTIDAIRAEIAGLEMTVDFGHDGLEGFLAHLQDSGLILAGGRPTPAQP